MRILITGTDGFVGSMYCLRASEAGHDMLGVDLHNRFKPAGCRTARLDIREEGACKDIYIYWFLSMLMV